MIYDTDEFPAGRLRSDMFPIALSVKPPFQWLDPRYLAGIASYPEMPPMASVVRDADLISGVLVDVAEGTLKWLAGLLEHDPDRRIRLVIIITPACPTRESHLRSILDLMESRVADSDRSLDVRVFAVPSHYGEDCRYSTIPPTTIQAHNTKRGDTWVCIGSVGDAGHGPVFTGSLNFVFRADPVLRNSWRNWFEYLRTVAAPLNDVTCRIPDLVPPQGSEEAALAWTEFMAACAQVDDELGDAPTVDPETGEVIADLDGRPTKPWDGGDTALDPLVARFQEIYAAGCLVTLNEQTRIKPLEIPVKAALLGQTSVKTVGALTQKQSFTLKVFDDQVCKELEKCRKITDLIELLTFPLSQGNRWLPNDAAPLLEREIEARNERGLKILVESIGGKPEDLAPASDDSPEAELARGERVTELVTAFITRKKEAILADLNQMYRDLKRGEAVPDDKAKEVLKEVERRVSTALGARITPTCTYNMLAPPDLSPVAHEDNWSQPLSLLSTATLRFREQLTDYFFDRKFSGQAFTKEEFLKACNVFNDRMVAQPDYGRAQSEVVRIKEILEGEMTAKEKCQALWNVVTGPVSTHQPSIP